MWNALAVLAATSLSSPAWASCYTFVGPDGEPVTNADSTLIVTFTGARTWVTMSADARGESSEFGFLLPVPRDFSVDDAVLVDPVAYEGLHAFAAPRQVEATCSDAKGMNSYAASGCGGPTGFSGGLPGLGDLEAKDSIVEEHRTLGAYDLSVLDPAGSHELTGWLDDNGFVLAPESEPMIEALLEEGVWFLAVGVDGGAGDGWVQPLRLGYEGRMNSIPLALGATSSDGVQDLVILVVDDTSSPARIGNYDRFDVEEGCMIDGDLDATYDRLVDEALLDGVEGRAAWALEAVIESEHQGTGEEDLDMNWLIAVGSESPATATLTRLHLRYTPDQIDEDLALTTSSADPFRTTYAAYDEQLESTYPICGEGWVTEAPGTCPAGSSQDAGATSSCASVPVGVPWVVLGLLGALCGRRRPALS